MATSNLSLKMFPEQRGDIAERLLSGSITDEQYFSEVRELEDQAQRQAVRDEFERVLSGAPARIVDELPDDPELDSRIYSYLARKFGIV